MKKVKDFRTLAKEKNFSDEYYPYADKGIKLNKKVYNSFITFIIILSIFLFFVFSNMFIKIPEFEQSQKAQQAQIEKLKKIEESQKNKPKKSIFDSNQIKNKITYRDHVKLNGPQSTINFIKLYLEFMSKLMSWFVYIFGAIFLIRLIRYLINVVKRNRMYERNVIINDFSANHLKARLLRSKKFKRRLKEAKAKVKDGKSISDDNEIEKYKELLNMKVNFNTRTSLDNDLVETQYRIRYNLPQDADVTENIMKETEKLYETANKILKGKIVFGERFVSTDRQYISFKALKTEEDKYLFDEAVKAKKKFSEVKVESESSYPTSLLIDKQAEIDDKKEKAQQWSIRASKVLDMYLVTVKMNVKRVKIETSNSNGLFIYEFAEGSNLPNIDNIGKNIDAMFKTKGSAASIANDGNLLITIPLPKSLNVPINVPTLYRDAYG